jgi:opacity protein-like surface antigen
MTSSPFSRYAYGDMNENVPAGYRAMGGVGFGMRSNKAINPSQPASYTAMDSLTFMFDVAASVSWSRYRDAGGMKNKANGNLEYVTLQFPLWKRWIAMSLGLLPYSSVGYDITLSDSISGYHFTKNYAGNGNISQVYGGLSFNICNWFALGANIYYMWGDLDRMRTLTFAESGLNTTIQDEILSVSDVRLRYGAQFFHTFGDHTFNIGAIYENKMKLNSALIVIETQTEDSIPIYMDGWQLPMVWGVGLSYNWAKRLTIGVDYERQCMADALYNGAPGRESGLQDRNRLAFGVEYRHNPNGRKYYEHMIWRAGLNIQDEYLASIGAKRISASIGFGFPLMTIGTVINTTIEYTHRGSAAGLEDNALRLTIGASVAENWFFKRKL